MFSPYPNIKFFIDRSTNTHTRTRVHTHTLAYTHTSLHPRVLSSHSTPALSLPQTRTAQRIDRIVQNPGQIAKVGKYSREV